MVEFTQSRSQALPCRVTQPIADDNISANFIDFQQFSIWTLLPTTMFSFDGQYKSRRVVSLGGASKKVYLLPTL